MDQSSFKFLEYFYQHQTVHLGSEAGKYLMLNHPDSLTYTCNEGWIIKHNEIASITREGREAYESANRDLTLLTLQKMNSNIQKRLKYVQYFLAVCTFINIVIAGFALWIRFWN